MDAADPCPFCGGHAGGRVKRKMMGPEPSDGVVARIEIENEAAALREALARQQEATRELQAEIEAERSAAASAASEAMAMILRLQREKSEAQMDARQFRRYAEERMSHDGAELQALEDLLANRDLTVQSLSAHVQSYKSRLFALGLLSPSSIPSSPCGIPDSATDYPQLRCGDDDDPWAVSNQDVETPRQHLQKIEKRIHLLEKMPSRVTVNQPLSPTGLSHLRSQSYDSFGSDVELRACYEFPLIGDTVPDAAGDRDDASDRVYTIDAVHGMTAMVRDDRQGPTSGHWGSRMEDEEIRQLSARLQALEADRESMQKAIMSMGTEKAQVVLLKEIAQQLCKDSMPQQRQQQQRKLARRDPVPKKFSFLFVVKLTFQWITSLVFRRKRPSPIRYPMGMCGSNVGLLVLLDQSRALRHRRFISKTERG